MPSNISRKKREIVEESKWFYEVVSTALKDDNETLTLFKDTIEEIKSQQSLPRETVMQKFNECLKDHPNLCDCVVGIRPDGVILLKSMEEEEPKEDRKMIIPSTPPQRFTHDAALSIIPHLPYPALGRLAKTCKWMNAHITDNHVENAVDRFLERFQKIELLTEPTGRRMIRMFTTNENVIEVGWMHTRNHNIVLLRIQGRVFITSAPRVSDYRVSFTDFFDHIVRHSTMENKPYGYIRCSEIVYTTGNDEIKVDLMLSSSMHEWNYPISMLFMEYVA